MDYLWPVLVDPASSRLEIIDSAGRFQSPLNGFTRTASRPGERMRLSLSFENLNAERRAAMQSFVAVLRGAVHRVLAYDHSHRIRGSFPGTELLSNNTFANGTTGWATNTSMALSVADRAARSTRVANLGSTFGLLATTAAASTTQYAPHVLRVALIPGRGAFSNLGLRFGSTSFGIDYGSVASLSPGLLTFAVTLPAATAFVGLIETAVTGLIAGEYADIPYVSLSRCALVDNGPNAMTRSDEIDHADWTKTRATASANTNTAPDGTITADSLIEDTTASSTHIFAPATMPARTSVAEDLCVFGDFHRGSGTRDVQLRVGSDGSNFSHCTFDLGAGTAGSVANVGTATNGRAFIRSLGNGWYRCYVIAQAAASTTIFFSDTMVSAGSNTYTGDGTSSIYAWRCGGCRSSVPVAGAQTTTTALPTGTAQTGNGIYVKGLPASTNGLLLPGDQYQLGNQIHIVTAPVNSDAAGLAFLEGNPARRSAAADNAPVIINQPMGTFFLESDVNGWSNKPGIFSDAEIVLVEAA